MKTNKNNATNITDFSQYGITKPGELRMVHVKDEKMISSKPRLLHMYVYNYSHTEPHYFQARWPAIQWSTSLGEFATTVACIFGLLPNWGFIEEKGEQPLKMIYNNYTTYIQIIQLNHARPSLQSPRPTMIQISDTLTPFCDVKWQVIF